jgi:hypothetical protein
MFVQKVVASASFPHFDSRKGSRIGTRSPLLGSENGAWGVQEVDFPHSECQLDPFEGLGRNDPLVGHSSMVSHFAEKAAPAMMVLEKMAAANVDS